MAARPGKSTGSPTKRASRMRINESPERTQLHDARIASDLKEQEMKGMAWLALAVAFFLVCASSEAQQTKPSAKQERPPTVASVMAVQMKVVEDQFVPVAEAMPEDKYSFVPTTGEFAGTRTFALQVKHVATANFVFFSAILGQEPPAGVTLAGATNGPDEIQTKAQIIQYLKDSFALGHKAFAALTERNAMTPLAKPPISFMNTRLAIATFSLVHTSDHY